MPQYAILPNTPLTRRGFRSRRSLLACGSGGARRTVAGRGTHQHDPVGLHLRRGGAPRPRRPRRGVRAPCGAKFQINYGPRDIRGDFFGIPDPKLEGEGGPEDTNDFDSL